MVAGNLHLEVVDHLRRPRGPGARNVLRLTRERPTPKVAFRVVPPVRLARRYAETWHEQDDPVTRQIRERVDFVAAAETERGAASQEERHIRAKRRRDIGELRLPQLDAPRPRESHERGRGVRASATETSLQRNALLQAHQHTIDRS